MKKIIVLRHGVRYFFEFESKFKKIFDKDIFKW